MVAFFFFFPGATREIIRDLLAQQLPLLVHLRVLRLEILVVLLVEVGPVIFRRRETSSWFSG